MRALLGENLTNYEEALIQTWNHSKKEEKSVVNHLQKNCFKNNQTKTMFPVRDKDHSMNMRNQEYFEVKFANTERLINSVIPAM